MDIHPRKKAAAIILRRFLFIAAPLALVLLPASVWAASLSFSPSQGTVAAGQTITVAVDASSANQSMNAASGNISFPSNKLRVVSISQSGSIINLWVQTPAFSNAAAGGDVSFQGALLNPGFTGTDGDILRIVFQALATGTASLSFSSGSILANNGSGTNILTAMEPATVTITNASSGEEVQAPPATTSPSSSASSSALTSTTTQALPATSTAPTTPTTPTTSVATTGAPVPAGGLSPLFLSLLPDGIVILALLLLLVILLYLLVREIKKPHVKPAHALTPESREKVMEDLKRLEREVESGKSE